MQSEVTETAGDLERQTLIALQALVHQLNRALDAVVYGDRQLADGVVASSRERTWECQRVQEGVMSALGRHPSPDELQALAALLHIARGAGRLSEHCKKIAMIVPRVPDAQRGPIFCDLVDPAARVAVSAVWLAKQSFATRDIELAHEVVRADAQLKRQSQEIYRAALAADRLSASSMAAFLAASYLERIGDIAVDLAEQTVIVVAGHIPHDVSDVTTPRRTAVGL
ncbi:MAG TPA: PhoU domain-containing protein [Solirubrobacteraceae bacterium]|nr:PhoU domain-containing protein [Solirubrobacteraceae bacterium]